MVEDVLAQQPLAAPAGSPPGPLDDHPDEAPPDSPEVKERIAELRVPKLHRFALGLAADWLVIIAAMVVARQIDHWAAYVAAVFIIGTRQHAIGILGHDGAHRMASRNRWLNNAVTELFCFWPNCGDMNGYRRFHFPHHRFLNTSRDPEMAYRELGTPEWDVPRTRRGILWRFVKDLCGLGAGEGVRLLYSMRPESWKGWIGPVATVAIAAAITVATGTSWILLLWFAAFFTSFAAVWRLRCWIEHLGTEDTHRVSMPRWLTWLVAPHNVWMHWEHHRWPAVPYWNLPRARALVPEVPVVSIWQLFKYYGECPPVPSGKPTLDDAGRSLIRPAAG